MPLVMNLRLKAPTAKAQASPAPRNFNMCSFQNTGSSIMKSRGFPNQLDTFHASSRFQLKSLADNPWSLSRT